MAVSLYELVDSRRVTVDRNGGDMTARLLAIGSTNEAEVYQAAVLDTTVSYFGTLFRSAIRVSPRGGGPYWDVEIDYSPIPPGEAIQNPGLNGGAGPANPVAPDPATPIGPGFAFSTGGGTTKIYQAIETRSITRSLPAIAAARQLKDHHGAINVTDDGAEGVDIVSRQGEWSIDVRRANVTLNYFSQLFYATGTVNDARFYGFAAGEVLYLGAEGRFSVNDQWQITHKFSVSPNENNKVIARDQNGVAQITVPVKKGWDYVWVQYYEARNGGVKRLLPEAAYVQKVYPETNFAALEIGA